MSTGERSRGQDHRFGIGLARAFGGSILFSLPNLMTADMWRLGFYVSRWRLALLLILLVPLLVKLSYHAGFAETFDWKDDVRDAFAGLAVAFCSSGLILTILGILHPGVAFRSALGMIALQMVPASIGAMLAQNQLGQQEDRNGKQKVQSYWDELFVMAVGALFLSFDVAPTQEMILIPLKMSVWHALSLVLVSLILMHAFVYAVKFRGQPEPVGARLPALFLRFTVTGYALVLMISAYVLWTLGRCEGLSFHEILNATIVLTFPGALGAATARLVL